MINSKTGAYISRQNANPTNRHIGVISTRLHGNDGVSLETKKWVEVLNKLGHSCFFFVGEGDGFVQPTMVVPEAHFLHPDILSIYNASFTLARRPIEITRSIHQLKDYLKDQIYQFTRQFDIELLIIQNALSIPLNIPLGLALTEFIAETGFITIAHHHDFYWERKRFLTNCVWDYLNMSFPPNLPSIRHVVINSSAANQISLRTGISATVIPNVMDFQTPPGPADLYTETLHNDLDLANEEYLFLQPTRVVQRKGIEHAIELVRRVDSPVCLVISHASGDEGNEYEQYIRNYAQLLSVHTKFVSDIISNQRGVTPDGRKIYSLADVYLKSDLVTYPSSVEGFGNAFLEAIYYRKPIVVNNYSIFAIDIKPKGFKVIEFDGYVTHKVVEQVKELLGTPDLIDEITEHNYQLAQRFYSYEVLEGRLETLLMVCFGLL